MVNVKLDLQVKSFPVNVLRDYLEQTVDVLQVRYVVCKHFPKNLS